MSQLCSATNLPYEMLDLIFNYFCATVFDLLRFERTCKVFFMHVNNADIAKNKYAQCLTRCGMVAPKCVAMCKSEAIDKLVNFHNFPLKLAVQHYHEFFQIEKQDYTCPIVVIGSAGVGKTSMVTRVYCCCII